MCENCNNSDYKIFLDPEMTKELCVCTYELEKILKNVTIEILRCPQCGRTSIGWYCQDDTEDITNTFHNGDTEFYEFDGGDF